MGVSSCTGPMGREELRAVMLGGLVMCGELTKNSSTFAANLEEYKCSASVQSLLITPKIG